MAKEYCVRDHLLSETRVLNSYDGRYRCRLCTNIRQLKYVTKKGKKFARNQNLKNKYGITLEEWEQLFLAQNNSCEICETKVVTKWHTDHCHTTGNVRGILCSACNINLGGFEALVKYSNKVQEYLK
jgi:hypothetical protein